MSTNSASLRLSSSRLRPVRTDDPTRNTTPASGANAENHSVRSLTPLLDAREFCYAGIDLLDPSLGLAFFHTKWCAPPCRCFYRITFGYCVSTLTLDRYWSDCITSTPFRCGRILTVWSDHDTRSFPRPILPSGALRMCPLPAFFS